MYMEYLPTFGVKFMVNIPYMEHIWVWESSEFEVENLHEYPKALRKHTLPETNMFAPENGWLEYFLVSFWGPRPIFRCKLLVSGSVRNMYFPEPTVIRQTTSKDL